MVCVAEPQRCVACTVSGQPVRSNSTSNTYPASGRCCRAISWNSRHSESVFNCGYSCCESLFRNRRAATSAITLAVSFSSSEVWNPRTSYVASSFFPLPSFASFTVTFFRFVYLRFLGGGSAPLSDMPCCVVFFSLLSTCTCLI